MVLFHLRTMLPAAVAAVVLSTTLAGQTPAPPASALLTAARNAIGGEGKVRAVKALRLTGTMWASQGTLGGYTRDTEDPLEVRVGFPDRFLRIEVDTMASPGVLEVTRGFDGDRIISTLRGKSTVSPASGTYNRKIAAELILLLMLRTEAWGGLSFEGAGTNALLVHGPNGYTARLEFDPSTHLLTKLVYRERREIRPPNTYKNALPGGAARSAATGGRAGGSAGSAADLPEVAITVTPRDRRDIGGGLLLPFRITTTAQGIDLWELRFEKILLNPVFTAADFGGWSVNPQRLRR
jgi:hypothetical protein